jgi:filamentous hemagglutinin family protein
MTQLFSLKNWILLLFGTVATVWVIPSLSNVVLGQELQPDSTLGQEKSVVPPSDSNTTSILITGGAIRGANLFHSFENFNVNDSQSVYFNNPSGIERIITRVTGSNLSRIDGKLGVFGGSADLFLLNPNGIIFGPNASLDLKGSFLATTASSYIFDDTEYSVIEPSPSKPLSISIPIGLRFRDIPGSIKSQSNVIDSDEIPVGLKVQRGKTLALVGGDITMEGGILTAPGGRIELGSISGSGQVKLEEKTWAIGYEGISKQSFGDISLKMGSGIVSRDEVGGSIYLRGRNVTIADGSAVGTLVDGSSPGGIIKVTASDTFLLTGRFSGLITSSFSEGRSGDIVIESPRVFLRDRSSIQSASTSEEPVAGVIVNSNGQSGNVTITSNQMEVSGGARILASTIGAGAGGDIQINSSYVDIFGVSAKGSPSGLFSYSDEGSSGQAGNITVNTRFLRVADGATINVSSIGEGAAGNIDIFARSVRLENQASISGETRGGEGNITFHEVNDIILRNNSSITTNATGSANGGNITINTGVLLALPPTGSDGSDIKAKADKGRGGNIVINAKGIFGIEKRIANPGDQTNDIDASSEFGRSGQVDINTATSPNNGLTELPETVVDPDTQVAQSPCNRGWGNELTVSGRGGLPPSPSQDLSSEATQVKLVEPVQASNGTQNNPGTQEKTSSLNSVPEAVIAPARGWVYNKKGQVVLVAYDPTITGAQRLKVSPAGCPVP